MAVYFYYGDEDFNLDLEIETMRSKLNQYFNSMNNQTLDNPKRIVYSTAHIKEFQRKMESQNIYYQVELLNIK